MSSLERGVVREVSRHDLALLLGWRNDPAVRRFMLTQHEISMAEHEAWYEASSANPARKLLIVEDASGPLGFLHFSGVSAGGAADWGFYARPAAPRGAGTRIGSAALDFAFGSLSLHKVCGQAFASNEASIRLHRKLGFSQEGVLREQHRLGGGYQDLICFGILEQEWK